MKFAKNSTELFILKCTKAYNLFWVKQLLNYCGQLLKVFSDLYKETEVLLL